MAAPKYGHTISQTKEAPRHRKKHRGTRRDQQLPGAAPPPHPSYSCTKNAALTSPPRPIPPRQDLTGLSSRADEGKVINKGTVKVLAALSLMYSCCSLFQASTASSHAMDAAAAAAAAFSAASHHAFRGGVVLHTKHSLEEEACATLC